MVCLDAYFTLSTAAVEACNLFDHELLLERRHCRLRLGQGQTDVARARANVTTVESQKLDSTGRLARLTIKLHDNGASHRSPPSSFGCLAEYPCSTERPTLFNGFLRHKRWPIQRSNARRTQAPKHLKEWIGRDSWDPAAFDLHEINSWLAEIKL